MAVMQILPQTFTDKLSFVLSSAVVCLVAYFLKALLAPNPLASIPVVGLEAGGEEKRRQLFRLKAHDIYLDGYKKFRDGIFRITTLRKSTVVVLSPKYLDELKGLPDDALSFEAAVLETLHAKYTQLEPEPIIAHSVKSCLTPGLVRLSPAIADEVQEALRREIPPCTDWTPVNINRKLLRIVAMASGRVMIGPELCRSEEYLDAAVNYTIEIMALRSAVDAIPAWLRPFKVPRLPEFNRLNDRFQQAVDFMKPIVTARLLLKSTDEKPNDMIQWLIDNQMKMGGDWSSYRQARIQLNLTWVSIHTTTLTATNAFYNIAAFPESIPEIRDEILAVLDENGGVFTTTALQGMKKLDSLLKETMRFDPLGASSFQRSVLKPLTLSTGEQLPVGTIIEVPSSAITRDPDIFPEPDKFDALRFYRQRQEAKEAGRYEVAAQRQFVSIDQYSLHFGYGRHACPGRFFAGNEIKMIVANCILKYDIKLLEGYTERYPNIRKGPTSIPDPTKELLFKTIVN